MKITDIKLRPADSPKYPDLAFIAAVTFDDELIINDIRVYERKDGTYKVKLPNHPIAAQHGGRTVTTTTAEAFNRIKSLIVEKIKEEGKNAVD